MDDELRGLTIVVGANGFYRTLASTTPFSLVKEHFSVRRSKRVDNRGGNGLCRTLASAAFC